MKRGWKGIGMIAVAALLWSMQGVLGKANTWGSFSLVGVRAIFASFVLGCVRKDFRIPGKRADWIGGAFVALTALLFLWANNLTSAANAIILQYTMPIFVMLFGLVFLHQKPTWGEFGVSICVLAGIILCVSGSSARGNLWGDVLALLSAVSYAGVFCAGKLLGACPKDYSYLGNACCLLCLLAIPFDADFQLERSGLLSAAAMGVMVGLGYAAFAAGMRENVQPTTAAILSNIEPVANPVWVFLFLGERPATISVAGFLMVLVTVSIYGIATNAQRRRAE